MSEFSKNLTRDIKWVSAPAKWLGAPFVFGKNAIKGAFTKAPLLSIAFTTAGVTTAAAMGAGIYRNRHRGDDGGPTADMRAIEARQADTDAALAQLQAGQQQMAYAPQPIMMPQPVQVVPAGPGMVDYRVAGMPTALEANNFLAAGADNRQHQGYAAIPPYQQVSV